MSPLFTSEELLSMRAIEESGMQDTYTRTSSTDSGTVDAWYDAIRTPVASVSGLVCAFKMPGDIVPGGRPQEQADPLSGNTRELMTPIMIVPTSDTIANGDTVTNVLDMNGTLIQPGPYIVGAVDILGSGEGIAQYKRVILHG